MAYYWLQNILGKETAMITIITDGNGGGGGRYNSGMVFATWGSVKRPLI